MPLASAHSADIFLLNLRQFSVEVLYSDEMYHFPNTMYHFKITAFIVKKIHTLPRCGLVTIQIVRHILCSNKFWCGFVCQGVFFHTNAVLKSCTFYTGSIVARLDLIFKLQYLMNYSSDFNNFADSNC